MRCVTCANLFMGSHDCCLSCRSTAALVAVRLVPVTRTLRDTAFGKLIDIEAAAFRQRGMRQLNADLFADDRC